MIVNVLRHSLGFFLLLLLPFCSAQAKAFHIAELEFKSSRIMDVIRVLAEDANVNIIATPDAGEKEVNIFLKDVSLEQAIKAICRISNLWYRRDEGKNGMFRLMTTEEYAKDLVVGQDDSIKVFQLHTPNVLAIASAIESLYDDRVEVSFGSSSQAGGSSSGGNSSNRSGGRRNRQSNGQSGSSRGGASNNSPVDSVPDDMTVEQLAILSSSNKQVDPKKLSAVAGIKKIIHVTVNTEHNLLIVKTSNQDVLKSIATLVKNLDKPQSQVMLIMKIVDIKVGEDFSSLVEIELKNNALGGESLNPIMLGAAPFTGGGTLMYEYVSKNIKVNLELLEQNNRVTVVSNPMLVASNHRPASLFVGEERVMVRGYSIDTIDTLNNSRTITTPETEVREIGTTLEVTPHINNDGTVHIILKQENATLNEGAAFIPVTNNSGSVVNLPVDTVTTAKLEGEIFAKHGYTIAVGGLIRDSFSRSRSKVPFFADIPIIGNLFRSTVDSDSQSEMVLLITPYILNHGAQPKKRADPTNQFHKYAPAAAMHSKKIPSSSEKNLVCGRFCAPANLTKTDL